MHMSQEILGWAGELGFKDSNNVKCMPCRPNTCLAGKLQSLNLGVIQAMNTWRRSLFPVQTRSNAFLTKGRSTSKFRKCCYQAVAIEYGTQVAGHIQCWVWGFHQASLCNGTGCLICFWDGTRVFHTFCLHRATLQKSRSRSWWGVFPIPKHPLQCPSPW